MDSNDSLDNLRLDFKKKNIFNLIQKLLLNLKVAGKKMRTRVLTLRGHICGIFCLPTVTPSHLTILSFFYERILTWAEVGHHLPVFFYKHCNISSQAQMLLSKSQIFLKMTLPYLTKKCLKCFLEWVQSFWKGLTVQISIVSNITVSK